MTDRVDGIPDCWTPHFSPAASGERITQVPLILSPAKTALCCAAGLSSAVLPACSMVIGRDMTEPSIDGALVGGASLKPDEMAGIVARAGVTAAARGSTE